MDPAFETAGGAGAPAAVVKLGDLTRVEIKLSRTEFAILRVLAQHAGRIITYSQLLREVWGPAYEKETHYLRIYIGHLRQKLGDDPPTRATSATSRVSATVCSSEMADGQVSATTTPTGC
jgi:hypothetical protein